MCPACGVMSTNKTLCPACGVVKPKSTKADNDKRLLFLLLIFGFVILVYVIAFQVHVSLVKFKMDLLSNALNP